VYLKKLEYTQVMIFEFLRCVIQAVYNDSGEFVASILRAT